MKCFWLFAALLVAVIAHAEPEAVEREPAAKAAPLPPVDQKPVPTEMPFHEEFARKLSLGIGTASQNYSFELTGGPRLTYEPNVQGQTVFTVNYAGLGGFSYGSRNSKSSSEDKKGVTNYQDFRVNFPYRRFNVFAFFSRYKGMYLSNSSDFDSSLPESAPYILFPDLYAQNMGINFTWVWNPERYSLAAVMDLTERQIKSGGSFLLGLTATETMFRSSGAIIPAQAKGEYAEDAEMYEGRVRALSAKLGYGYTDVFRRRYFLSGNLSVALGPQEVRISTPAEDYSIVRLGLNFVEFYGAIGYNGERFFCGFNASSAIASYEAKKAKISAGMLNGGVFFGGRF